MNRNRFWILLLCLLLFACSRPPAPPVVIPVAPPPEPPVHPPDWKYEREAIRLNIVAHPELNLYEGAPHTILLCVYQLRHPNGFNQLIGEPSGLPKVLQCQLFDPSAVSSTTLFIQPGERKTITLDRAEGARYVAVAAGYYLLMKEGATALFEIPVVIERGDEPGREKVATPKPLHIHLNLGPQQFQSTRSE